MAGPVPYDEIKSFLATQFSGVYSVIDFDEIDQQLVAGQDAFLALEELAALEDVISIGSPDSMCIQETGALVVHCFSPAPESSNATRAIAEAVRNALRLRVHTAVRVTDPGVPDPGMMMNDGIWSAASLSITYEWDTHVVRP